MVSFSANIHSMAFLMALFLQLGALPSAKGCLTLRADGMHVLCSQVF